MAKYVMSDLHGCYDEFIQMLDLINFSPSDELYILGDIIDRGPNPLALVDFVLEHDNVILLKGNHEAMCTYSIYSRDDRNWIANGGDVTLKQLEERGNEFKFALAEFFDNLPLVEVVDKFILVHAGLTLPSDLNNVDLYDLLNLQKEKDNLWTREYLKSDLQYRDYKIICGHTPVMSLITHIKSPSDVKFVHRPGYVFIDCGCVFKKYAGRLGCLRLDDMKEFYV